jgi:hypothetical protein
LRCGEAPRPRHSGSPVHPGRPSTIIFGETGPLLDIGNTASSTTRRMSCREAVKGTRQESEIGTCRRRGQMKPTSTHDSRLAWATTPITASQALDRQTALLWTSRRHWRELRASCCSCRSSITRESSKTPGSFELEHCAVGKDNIANRALVSILLLHSVRTLFALCTCATWKCKWCIDHLRWNLTPRRKQQAGLVGTRLRQIAMVVVISQQP